MERLTERDSNEITFLVCREGCNGGPACIECEQKAIDLLAAYEDTGLEPEEIKNIIDGAIKEFSEYDEAAPKHHLIELAQAEKDGRLVVLPPNAPLTLEQLREMDGEPVWIERVGDTLHIFDRWAFVDKENCLCRTSDGSSAFFEVYGKSWFAYRRKPEEGTT